MSLRTENSCVGMPRSLATSLRTEDVVIYEVFHLQCLSISTETKRNSGVTWAHFVRALEEGR